MTRSPDEANTRSLLSVLGMLKSLSSWVVTVCVCGQGEDDEHGEKQGESWWSC